MDDAPTSDGAGALDRAMALFAAILRDGGASPLVGLASEIGIPPSTAHRIAAMLVRRRLLVRASRGRYIAGYGLAAAGGRAAAHRSLSCTSRALLGRLAAATHATAHLGVLDGDMVTYLVKAEASIGAGTALSLFTREGMQLEAYCSAIGKILLADLPADELDNYLANGPFIALTPHTLTDPAAIRDHLDKVRTERVAIDDREVADNLLCVAMPVRAPDGRTIAAISISRLHADALPDETTAIARTARDLETLLFS